ADDPRPGPGEVTVRLNAAALNRRDVFIRLGQYAGIKLPLIPGADGAGVIHEVGEGVDPLRAGQEVVIDPALEWGENPRAQGSSFRMLGLPPDGGTYAQLLRVPVANVHPRPGALSWEEAAALPLAGLTAYRALITRGNLHAGDTVLVPGIGGGVATFVLLFARRLGARVLVTSGNEEKLARARALGAEAGFNYHDSDWIKQVRAATDGQGPDLIVESIGGEPFNQLLDVAKPGGRIVSYGATLGPVPNLVVRRIFWKQLDVLGSTMGRPGEFAMMLSLFEDGALRPVVDRVFPLAEAGAAQARMEQAAQFGKIVLSIPR
ncbi:MAG TPA: zinc-binding dehydrogenase, partial [Chloroflexota bacterium]|nr:zinc-binding dehydrogenase [Chloroflexota bacterium]